MGLFGNSKNSTPITCEFCSKQLGLNRYAIGKTASGKMLWKCPDCAKKGGYMKIVGEKAYMCTKDGEIIETENYNKEIRVKCNTCGHIYCYTQSDLDRNNQIAKKAVWSSLAGVGQALGGSAAASATFTGNAENTMNQIVDYSKCPSCHSTDIHILTDAEWELEKTNRNSTNSASVVSSADELKKFKELLDSGVITQEEFDAKKKQLLGL